MKTTTDSLRRRIITLAYSRVVKHRSTPKAAAEYTKTVKALASRTRRKPGTIRLWARRCAYRNALQ